MSTSSSARIRHPEFEETVQNQGERCILADLVIGDKEVEVYTTLITHKTGYRSTNIVRHQTIDGREYIVDFEIAKYSSGNEYVAVSLYDVETKRMARLDNKDLVTAMLGPVL